MQRREFTSFSSGSRSRLAICRIPRRRLGTRAFSLVEVVIAIAVLSFALLPLVALLTVGVSQVKNNTQATVTSEILTAMNSQVRQTSYTNLGSTVAGPFYFDDLGVSNSAPANAVWTTTYTAASAVLPNSAVGSIKVVTVVTQFTPHGVSTGQYQTNFIYTNAR